MFAKILNNNKVYYSPVFALTMKGRNNKAIVLDESFTQLVVVEFFQKYKYKMLFLDYNAENFAINENDFKSYWNDRKIFEIVKSKKYTQKMLDDAKELLSKSTKQDFVEVRNSSDVESLMLNAGYFHDSYILEMKQDRDNLEILIDTSWGVFMILKCEGVLENGLNYGNTYYGIDVKIEDEFIEFVFESIYGGVDEVLRVRKVSFKPIFEIRIKIKDFKYEVSKSGLSLNIGNNWVDCSNNGILDFKQRKVLGYLQNDNVMQAFIIFNQEIGFKFYEYSTNKKRSAKLKSKVAEFQNRCQEKGFCFDKYPLYDCDSERFEFDWGELLYVHKYPESKRWLSTGKIILFALLGSCAIWIPLDLFISQAPGHIFLIFGLGVWLFIVLIMVYSTLLGRFLDNKRGNSSYLEIRENGLKYSYFNRGFNVDYENIVAVKYKKRIIIQAWIKYELEGFKNDIEAYELIKTQVEKSKTRENPPSDDEKD